ncbi:membrane protein [Streptomyces eurocidicus]|uniref:Membrane protein n=1 Tax=Streptomyces eurocidicus TaxID=66423 RepID=A0A2N8P341_STREU|nr:FUSC family protein [Streptomyces eurocidicus]MBB5117610.1 putative membrane protein YccC [Streptomyces eurocidicus]MBF6053448.1 FUSC family protein [Streptomyces eurocidicus]PNE35429.1 membrane protein [Streptomyces eurocidicus]
MTWSSALRKSVRTGLTVERTTLTPLLALRSALGVAIVIGLMLWFGTPKLAVSSAFGAFAAGVAIFQRSWRPRPVLALAVAVGLAVSTFLGYVAAHDHLLFAALLGVWTLLAGMAWAIGPVSGLVATQTVAVMLVTVTLPTSVSGALHHAGLIAFGGLVQATLIVLLPIRPWGLQRDALADALAAEADYARRLRHDPVARFDPQPLMDAREAAELTPRQARSRPRQLGGPRGVAERIRPVLASLADPVLGAPAEGPERDRARDLLGAAASVLDSVARAIRWGRPVRLSAEAVDTLEVPESGPILDGAARRSALRLIALLGDAVEATDEPVRTTAPRNGEPKRETKGEPKREHRHLLRPSVPRLVPVVLRALRREARWSSPIGRHGVRVAVVALIGYALGSALPLGHGYWVPLTSVMVMRPDFGQTYSRGVGRFVGTVVGVLIAGALMALFHPGTWVCAALAVLCIGLMYLLMGTGYSVASACIAGYVVFLLGIAGEGWSQTVQARVALTLLGGLLAMAAYALFPTWETPRLRDRLADWLEANGRYSLAVLGVFAEPAEARPRRVREALLDSRAARTAWEDATARALTEPVRHRGISRTAERAAESALATMGRATMLMEAHLPERSTDPSKGAAAFAGALRTALPAAATAVRERRAPDWSAPRAALDAWRAEAGDTGVAVRGTELLTDALEELAAALSPGPGGRNRAARRL